MDKRNEKDLNKHAHYFVLFDISQSESEKLKQDVFKILVDSEKFCCILISAGLNPSNGTFTHHILLKTSISVVRNCDTKYDQ